MQNHQTNNNISSIQTLVFNELPEAFSILNTCDQDHELEEGELSWALGALGRAIRLETYLNQDIFPKESSELIQKSLELFKNNKEWQDEFLLENHFSEFLDSFEEILQEDESTAFEIMHYMIELDRLICALQIPIASFQVHNQPTTERLLDSVSLFVDLYPESFCKVSEKASNFIACHGVQDAWGKVWKQIIETSKRAEALAKLKRQDAELDLKQPLSAFDFSAYLNEEELQEEDFTIEDIWKKLGELFGKPLDDFMTAFKPFVTQASADKETELISDQDYKSLVILTGKITDINSQQELDLKDNKLECFLTFSEAPILKFNVNALNPINNMRIKLGQRIINSDQEDGLFATVAINPETDLTKEIQVLIDQYTVYETSLIELLKQ